MKPLIAILLILVFGLAWQNTADAAEARSRARRDVPTVGVAPAPLISGDRRYERRVLTYVYPYYYPGFYPYNPPFVVSPYAAYYTPPPVVVTLPYFCVLHQTGWVTRA